ncbi:MAG TPA: hypothetical protein VGR07_01725, partial [Thermoanaerobaculia bacterium]|nr:hypothetical protein [Thermoanaerobaculia bacterium]
MKKGPSEGPRRTAHRGTAILVAAEVTQSAADVEQLLPMVEQTCTVTQGVPSEVLADAGYRSEDNLQGLEGKA